MDRKTKNHYLLFGLIMIAVGVGGFSFPFVYDMLIANIPVQEEMIIPAAVATRLPTFDDSFIAPNEDVSATPIPTPSATPSVIKDRLVIGNVSINMPVFLGDTEKTLNKGGWLFPATSRPEKGGNSVIFGHRYMYRPPKSNTFWNLDKVKIGDEMVLYWKNKEYKYKVFDIKVVEPTDLSVIQPTADARLTVITCTPLFTTKQRLVVVGSLISQ